MSNIFHTYPPSSRLGEHGGQLVVVISYTPVLVQKQLHLVMGGGVNSKSKSTCGVINLQH